MTGQNNKLRIIGGQWRGRKLNFPDAPGLRPTPDRVRETLFNWLHTRIAGSHCLDLFAGSGALGFEALSRDAKHVTMIDNNREVIATLEKNITLLGADNVKLLNADVSKLLAQVNSLEQTFDIVFLDPPYHQDLITVCCEALEDNGFLAPVSYLYMEAEFRILTDILPETFSVMRSKKAGNVNFHLIKREKRA